MRQQHLCHLNALPLLHVPEPTGDDVLPFKPAMIGIEDGKRKIGCFAEVLAQSAPAALQRISVPQVRLPSEFSGDEDPSDIRH